MEFPFHEQAPEFASQVLVVTSAGGGRGRAYCKLLAALGAAVIVNDLGGSTAGESTSPALVDAGATEYALRLGRL